jgi:hypothetical protein
MKSIYQTLGEVTEKLADAGKFKKYLAASANCTSIESKIACAESILRSEVIKEVRGPITKHNGAGDNRSELFTESHSGGESTNPREAQVKGYMATCHISEAEARKVLGLPPAGLTRKQRAEYLMAVASGINESKALELCKK